MKPATAACSSRGPNAPSRLGGRPEAIGRSSAVGVTACPEFMAWTPYSRSSRMLFGPVMRTFRASSVLAHAVLRGPGPGTRPAARQGHGAAISRRVCAFPEPGRGMPACGSAAQGRQTGLRRGRKPAMYGHQGHVAEWLRSGLQIRLRGFDSLRGLQDLASSGTGRFAERGCFLPLPACASLPPRGPETAPNWRPGWRRSLGANVP